MTADGVCGAAAAAASDMAATAGSAAGAQPPTDVPWLDATEAAAWRGVQRMFGELTVELGRRLAAESGLSTADYAVLVQLTDVAEARLRASALGAAMGWEQSRVSHHVARMARRGLVSIERCPSDRRGSFVVLTPAGRSAIVAAAPGHVAAVRELFVDLLSADELEVLAGVSGRVLAKLGVTDHVDVEADADPRSDAGRGVSRTADRA